MTDLASIEERARRVLDGMTINREAFARDVLALGSAARRLQKEVLRLNEMGKGTGGDVLGAVFGDIFGGRRNG